MSDREQARIIHPLYPLFPTQRLDCQLCGDEMDWNGHAAMFECDCRNFGVSAEAIESASCPVEFFDVTVVE